MSDADDLIRLDHIDKRYGGIQALEDASLTLRAGEVHALVGANGAGKSTIKNVLAGIVVPDAGTVTVGGDVAQLRRPADALRLGVRAVHQEGGLIPWMSVQDNMHLGRFPVSLPGVLRRGAMRDRTREALRDVGLDVAPGRSVRSLSVGQQQLVEIARAASARPRAILLDEPSAILVGPELERLFAVVERLRAEGVAILYVSHRFDEIFRLADRVTIMRNGRTIRTDATSAFDRNTLIREMSGRVAEREARPRSAAADDVRLELRDVSAGRGRLSDVSLTARRGEIVGIAGLMGSGRSHLLKTVFGIDARQGGAVLVDGRELRAGDPRTAIAAGVVLVPEDRKDAGLILDMSVQANIGLTSPDRVAPRGVLQPALERALGTRLAGLVGLAPERLPDRVGQLSGGNQQKVAIARWLAKDPTVLLMDEPTRGVDVEAKAEIHALITRLAADGSTVVVVSSEFEELTSLCHRVLVMYEGRIVGGGDSDALTPEDLLRMCSREREEEIQHG